MIMTEEFKRGMNDTCLSARVLIPELQGPISLIKYSSVHYNGRHCFRNTTSSTNIGITYKSLRLPATLSYN